MRPRKFPLGYECLYVLDHVELVLYVVAVDYQ